MCRSSLQARAAERSYNMKILAVGDIHGDTSLTERLARKAQEEHVDAVVLCGDLTFFSRSVDGIVGPFRKRGQKVLLIPGNHEDVATVDFLAERYGAKNIHGYAVRYDDVGIFGAGGAEVGPFATEDSEIFELLKQSFERIQYLKKKIMVTHVHPAGSKMESLSAFVSGSPSVKKAIDEFKPDIMLCGHIHEASGIEEKIGSTRVINVSKEGRIIEL